MSNRVLSPCVRRVSLALGLALILLWLLGGVFITTNAVQAQPIDLALVDAAPIDLTRPLAPNNIITVTNANDDGPGSLRQAIATVGDGDIITFDNDYAIYLSSTLNISKQLTIDGGSNIVTVSGDSFNDGSRDVRVFFITSTVAVTLNHLHIVSGTALFYDGMPIYFGGGIYIHSESQLTVLNTTFEDNIAQLGGGIDNEGALTLINCAFTSNTAVLNGGGIANGGTLTMMSNTLLRNSANESGGAIANNGTITVLNSHLADNVANNGDGGGIVTGGIAQVSNTTISNNTAAFGGGISNYNTLFLTNTTLSGNSAAHTGGALYNYSTLTATNSTFSDNLVQGSDRQYDGGGAIDQWGPTFALPNAVLKNVTFADNNAPNVAQRDGIWLKRGNLTLHNVLGAHNGTANCTVESTATLTATIDSMSDDATCVGATSVPSTTLILAPLADNGGSTWTMALLNDSPAIDAGDDATCPLTDQRGVTRPQGPHCDIGAYEFVADKRYVATTGVDASNVCLDSVAPCATVQHAIDVANDGEQVLIASGLYTQSATLYKPVSLTGVSSDTTIIHAVAGQRVLTVTGTTISNSVVISGLTFTGGTATNGTTCPDGCGGGLLITAAAQPALQNLIVMDNQSSVGGGGIYVDAGIAITLTNINVISNTSEVGGGVEGFDITLFGGRFEHNTAHAGGGLAASVLFLSGTQFISNTASDQAGGAGSGSATVIGGRFESNYAGGTGGGLGIYGNPSSVTITGTEFLSNTAENSAGGGLYADGSITAVHTRFENNRSLNGSGGGGGLYTYGNVILIDTQFINNSAWADGGGASVIQGAIVIDGYFERNASNHGTYYDGGGGLGAGHMSLTNTQFLSNTSNTDGGGASAIGSATIVGGRFQGNYAAGNGGGLNAGPGFISGTRFIANAADYDGGGQHSSEAQITSGYFENNTARGDGGGLFVSKPFITATQFISNSAGRNGGGLNHSLWTTGYIINSLFLHNTASSAGTEMYLNSAYGDVILQTTIASASRATGAAIGVARGTIRITNTVIASHTVAISNTGGTVYEDYNLFFGNITNTIGATSGGHSLIGDPKFVDPFHDDYHLQAGSAAIDHGIDAGVYTDLDGNPRPIGAGFDIGAYEYPFVPSNYTLTVAMAGTGSGVVSPTVGTHQYLYGDVVTLTATPLISSTFTGWSGDVNGTSSPITVTMDADKSVTATFMLNTYVITPTAGAHGSITPSTPQTVNYGASQTFTITPNTGYHITDVGVDGISQGAIDLYAFTNVTANHTISAAFAINTFVITPTAGAHGTITPSTPQTVNYGASQTFTITPNSGYHIADVSVDGISQGAIDLYAFTNVTANHIISAAFALNAPNTYTLTVNYAGTGLGSVTLNPPGPTYIAGTIVTLTATPSITSTFSSWSGDVVTTTNPITATMTSNKTVTATFTLKQSHIFLPIVAR